MIFINYSSIPAILAVPQVNLLFASFLLRRLEFDPYEVRVGFMVDKVIPRFSPEHCKYHSTKPPYSFSFFPGISVMGPVQVTIQQRHRLIAPEANKKHFSL
jgi:hypothetical protein